MASRRVGTFPVGEYLQIGNVRMSSESPDSDVRATENSH